jgi:cytochrome c peroxidase
MKLFFTKGLGGDKDSACVSCHHPALGGGDNLSLPIGVAAEVHDLLGPGRRHSTSGTNFDGGPTVPRNAPTTFNIALWDKVLFHDGRVECLSTSTQNCVGGNIRTPDSAFGATDTNAGANLAVAQARFPVTSAEEMRGFVFESGNTNAAVRTHLQNRFNGTLAELSTNNWLTEFRTGFNNPTGTAATLITFANIVDAIGEYERSQIFVDNPWKDYVAGNKSAISEDAKKGALLFFRTSAQGGANCAACHSGDFFTDEKFHVIAMPQIGRGKGNGTTGDDDFGRFRETGVAADKYAFRTPTLLNVEVTGPYGHAGGYTTLTDVVKHHLNPQNSITNYDFTKIDSSIQAANMKTNTQLAMDTLTANRTAGTISPILEDITLTDTQVSQLVAFLKTLTDPCLKMRSCIAKWIPDASDTNPDALRVHAIDKNGNSL